MQQVLEPVVVQQVLEPVVMQTEDFE